MRSTLVRAVLFAGTAALAQAQGAGEHSSVKLGNPFTSPSDRQAGSMFFRSQCASCHGQDGKGGAAGPDLSRGQFKHAVSDEAMFRVITKGIPGTVMPATSLEGQAVWQIVTHIRSLNDERASTGDVVKGAALFNQLQCSRCHAWNAPDLRESAARLTLDEIRQSIIDPNAQVSPEQWRWRAKKPDGTIVQGRRMNEDTFSIQVLGADGKLQSYDRGTLSEAQYDKRSTMPSFKDKLNGQDLENLTAYVRSLRGTK